jgi:hypothetical protein
MRCLSLALLLALYTLTPFVAELPAQVATPEAAVEPAVYHSPNGEKRQVPGEKLIGYVAILIAPPPQAADEGVTSRSDTK